MWSSAPHFFSQWVTPSIHSPHILQRLNGMLPIRQTKFPATSPHLLRHVRRPFLHLLHLLQLLGNLLCQPPPPTTATSADSTVHLGTPPHHTSEPNPTTFNPTTSTAPIATINTSTAPIAATLLNQTTAASAASTVQIDTALFTQLLQLLTSQTTATQNIRVSRQCRLPGTCFHRSYSYQRRSQSQGHYRRIPYSVPLQEKPYLCRRRGHSIAATASASTQGGHLKTPPEQLLQGGSGEPTAQTTTTTTATKTKTIHYHDEYYEEMDTAMTKVKLVTFTCTPQPFRPVVLFFFLRRSQRVLRLSCHSFLDRGVLVRVESTC